jgi:predicted esterase
LGGVRAAAPILDAFIDEALEERGLNSDELALIGFSQFAVRSGKMPRSHFRAAVSISSAVLRCRLTPLPMR